jgi:hypothetical protein
MVHPARADAGEWIHAGMTAEVPAREDEVAADRMIAGDRDRGAVMTAPAVEDEALEVLVANEFRAVF